MHTFVTSWVTNHTASTYLTPKCASGYWWALRGTSAIVYSPVTPSCLPIDLVAVRDVDSQCCPQSPSSPPVAIDAFVNCQFPSSLPVLTTSSVHFTLFRTANNKSSSLLSQNINSVLRNIAPSQNLHQNSSETFLSQFHT